MMLTESQLRTLRHMLGINRRFSGQPEPYRDYYAASPGDPELAEMARLGVVVKYAEPSAHMPYDMYRTTEAGRTAAIRSHRDAFPPLSRGQRRYDKFLDCRECCEGLTFREFLTDERYREAREAA